MTEPSAAQRCSLLSAARGEPMLGTAFPQRGVLLVEQPGPWGHAGLRASRFDPRVAAEVETRAGAAGLRVLAIRRPARDGGRLRRWAVTVAGGLAWGRYATDADLLDVPLDGAGLEADATPTYLVCAHGKRDVCCALNGRPLAAALEALRPGRVWECSHTGGHRFAPIVLALPVGALYGRVPLHEVADLVAATERGEVVAPLLRGELGHPPAVQAALGRARVELSIAAADGLAVVSADEIGPDEWRVHLAAAGGMHEVAVRLATVPTPFPSCGKPGPKDERVAVEIRLSSCHGH